MTTELEQYRDKKNQRENVFPLTLSLNLAEAELNAHYCVQVFEEGIAPAIEKITPSLIRAFRDFSQLSKGETIMGCKTQEQWARKYFHKTKRALNYMISGGNARSMRERRAKARELSQFAAEQSETPLLLVGDLVKLAPEATSAVKLEPRSDSSHGEKIPGTNTVGPESATPEPSQQDSLQKAQADLSAAREWIRQLQTLVREISPRQSSWAYLTNDQQSLWERYVEKQP